MAVGVFEKMRKEYNNLITSGKVEITQSSYWSDLSRFSGHCLVNDDAICFFCTKNETNSNVVIRIVNNPISIQGIKLDSVNNNYAPLAWLLEGSNDNKYYEPIISISESICDKFQDNVDRVCDGQFNKTYNIQKNKGI